MQADAFYTNSPTSRLLVSEINSSWRWLFLFVSCTHSEIFLVPIIWDFARLGSLLIQRWACCNRKCVVICINTFWCVVCMGRTTWMKCVAICIKTFRYVVQADGPKWNVLLFLSTRFGALCGRVWVWVCLAEQNLTSRYSFQQVLTLLNNVQHFSTLFNTFQHFSTFFNTFQHSSTLFNTFQHASTLWALVRLVRKISVEIPESKQFKHSNIWNIRVGTIQLDTKYTRALREFKSQPHSALVRVCEGKNLSCGEICSHDRFSCGEILQITDCHAKKILHMRNVKTICNVEKCV